VIPLKEPSHQRQARADDLPEGGRRQQTQTDIALAEMVADTERLGLYDVDTAELRGALNAARKSSES
jgi:hypothetical protein